MLTLRQTYAIDECVRLFGNCGSVWGYVRHFVENGEAALINILTYPLPQLRRLKLKNQIVTHFGHGVDCSHHPLEVGKLHIGDPKGDITLGNQL